MSPARTSMKYSKAKDCHRAIRHVVLAIFILLANSEAGLCESETEFNLKSDTAKLDTTIKPKKLEPLRGSVQHSQQMSPSKKEPLSGSAGTSASKGLSGRAVNSGSLLKGRAKEVKPSKLNAELQSGIGIIGVKFIMAFGQPPVINRVFPQTPASENDLHSNDIIVAVDGIPTYGLTKEEVYNMIVGTPNTPVTISVRRKGDFQVHTMQRMDLNDIVDPRVRRDYMSM